MSDSRKKQLQIRNSTAEFLIFTAQSGEGSIEVRYEDETIWLTQKLMATLFDVTVPTVSEHLSHIYDQGEVSREATVRKFRIVRPEGRRDAVIDPVIIKTAYEREPEGSYVSRRRRRHE